MKIISLTAKISHLADIEDSVKGSTITIGEDVMIDSFVKIKFAGGLGDIVIGNNTFINSGCVLYSGNGIKIGSDVLIASNCTIAAVNHQYIDGTKLISDQGFMDSKGGVTIEDDVWIGAGVVLLDGAHIKKGCVIGAGCIINKQLEEYGVYVGNPLKCIRYRK